MLVTALMQERLALIPEARRRRGGNTVIAALTSRFCHYQAVKMLRDISSHPLSPLQEMGARLSGGQRLTCLDIGMRIRV